MRQPLVSTVLGVVAPEMLGITDAHTHAWISPPHGTAPQTPRLTDSAAIADELEDYRSAGGGACEATVADTPAALLAAVAEAGRQTGAAVGVHTERGADAEAIVDYFARRGAPPSRLILFHMDKRPDFALHRTLAGAGVLLEYDTFYRPQYDPDTNAWPLIERMVTHDLQHAVALGTDLVDAAMWARLGRGPGLPGFARVVRARLETLMPTSAVRQLMGANIARRLTRDARENA